jgi:hypothetical protein
MGGGIAPVVQNDGLMRGEIPPFGRNDGSPGKDKGRDMGGFAAHVAPPPNNNATVIPNETKWSEESAFTTFDTLGYPC